MKIAIVGSGISGLVAAYRLCRQHDITLFEANGYLGGHTHTHDIHTEDETYAIDTGFIVFNDWTYPNFISLLDELGVASQVSSMSFSVKCEKTGLEYNGTNLNSLFAQRRNLLNIKFWCMIRDILRFNKTAPALIDSGNDYITLGEYLEANRYGSAFIEQYVVPMGAAIWSTDPALMLNFPARFFVRFFHNHGMLNIDNRPVWRVIKGGSKRYVKALTKPFIDRIRLNSPVMGVKRHAHGVTIASPNQGQEEFDAVILACHSDQALHLLEDPSVAETDILSAIPYQKNDALLHTDTRVLPKNRLAWAAWNYHIPRDPLDHVALTYNMNILQTLHTNSSFCVSLNYLGQIADDAIIKRLVYHHPLFTPKGVLAQQRHGEISGVNRTYYCGAYWGFGFHEDGVKSGLRVVGQIENNLE